MISGTFPPFSANFVPRSKKSDNEGHAEKKERRSTRKEINGRSAAIERAYVHDVYENCDDSAAIAASTSVHNNRQLLNPSVTRFLADLEPGSLVCDVGSGDGRYLTAATNPYIYTLGVDRCFRLTTLAHERGGEVAICDNLDLPFRDESFDAVLSLAVVHHFATAERRVGAIRELARILRIGGRVIITVWALEQKNRRFESQDVLVPWHSNSKRNGLNGSADEDEDEDNLPYHPCIEDSTNSSKSTGDGDTSSLSSSSPSDTCYSFVRRAIQKLASGKRILESWSSKDAKHDNSFDFEDAKDLPIELRRIEDLDDFVDPPIAAGGLNSNDLASILNPPCEPMVHSQSSLPSLSTEELAETLSCQTGSTPSLSLVAPTNSYASMESLGRPARPKLMKQKQSLQEDVEYPSFEKRVENEAKEAAAFKDILTSVKANDTRVQLLRKQSSLNEELMAESRIREKERIRKRIQKQTSLNETFLCRSVITKRLQVIREGFTTKLKTSTGSIERVTKNGFVKMMQNIKIPNPNQFVNTPQRPHSPKQHNPISRTNSEGKMLQPQNPEEERARRHSRESGSDSSKESSLQSDTSIESEDSFASVIFIPKPEQLQQMNSSFDYTLTMNPNMIPSVPTSPLVFPCPTPAHSPAPPRCKAPTSGTCKETIHFSFEQAQIQKADDLLINKMTKVTSPPLQSAPPAPATTPTTKSTPRITREDVRNLPPIPRYPPSHPKRHSNYPIVRRVAIVPKPKSLELFNPETDDLDSDSSEPSSPDSVDSVISAVKSPSKQSSSDVPDVIVNKEENVEMVIRERRLHLDHGGCDMEMDEEARRKHLVDFAEKLSAQLLKELESESARSNRDSQVSTDDDPYLRKLNNGESKDFNQLRKELRERRLMLADLGGPSCNNNNNDYNREDDFRRRYHDLIPEEECEDDRPDIALIQDSPEDQDENKANNNFVNRLRRKTPSNVRNRQSGDSWMHSTSTASLDSPSVGGGSATHHRYFHVFREGELDTLINHHVASLHIVSSYYERASWCVVAEKVQVWTI